MFARAKAFFKTVPNASAREAERQQKATEHTRHTRQLDRLVNMASAEGTEPVHFTKVNWIVQKEVCDL